jgi:hypothetical protein
VDGWRFAEIRFLTLPRRTGAHSERAIEMEKRRFERTPCKIDSFFTSLAEDRVSSISETMLQDISEGGIRFRANQFIPVHHKLLFKINIPNQKTIEAVTQPAWIREIPTVSQYDIGAKFISLSEGDRDIIRHFTQNVFFEA